MIDEASPPSLARRRRPLSFAFSLSLMPRLALNHPWHQVANGAIASLLPSFSLPVLLPRHQVELRCRSGMVAPTPS
jgi:hypothetical protein